MEEQNNNEQQYDQQQYNQQQYNQPQNQQQYNQQDYNQQHFYQNPNVQQPENQSSRYQQQPNGQYGQESVVKNPGTNTTGARSPEMNDHDYLNDVLDTEKYLTDCFNVFLRETSHQGLFTDVKHILNQTHDQEKKLFNLMFARGYYSLKAASSQDIQQAIQKFTRHLADQNPYASQGQYQYSVTDQNPHYGSEW